MKDWQLEYSPGVTLQHNADGTWQFEFPATDGVHYLTRLLIKAEAGRHTAFLACKIQKISGQPLFKSVDTTGPMPPSARLMVQRADDDMRSEDGRWWSNPACIVLNADGNSQTLSVQLSPNLWSNVNGHFGNSRPAQFADAMKNLGRLGITFGGGNSFGHGVYATGGRARFTLIKCKLQ